MRSDKRKKLAVGIGLILCFLLLVGGILSGMSGQVKAVPDNPMDGISQKRSQVLYTGTGYYTSAISKKENQKTDLPKTEVLETETESEAETETETELETELQTEVTTETETGGTETTTETGRQKNPSQQHGMIQIWERQITGSLVMMIRTRIRRRFQLRHRRQNRRQRPSICGH